MKKIGLILILFALMSCDKTPGKGETNFMRASNVVTPSQIEENHDIVVIDGCEYIVYTEYHGYEGFGFMAHKGNCSNPVHKH